MPMQYSVLVTYTNQEWRNSKNSEIFCSESQSKGAILFVNNYIIMNDPTNQSIRRMKIVFMILQSSNEM